MRVINPLNGYSITKTDCWTFQKKKKPADVKVIDGVCERPYFMYSLRVHLLSRI